MALAAALGLLSAMGMLLWRPRGWIALLCFAIGLAAFGVFGIADRELVSPIGPPSPATPGLWRLIRLGAMVLGVVAGFGLLLALLAIVLGTWIS